MAEMTPEQAAALRAPFPPEVIGKLPKITCKACSDAREKHCGQHKKTRCDGCDNYITEAHMHIDYAGHAAVTDRLLQVDPKWTWRPLAVDPNTGAPLIVSGGLWIELDILGVKRIGYGDGKSVKEMIGDAIRNAAMRYGVALDLWAKTSLIEGQHDEPSPDQGAADRERLDLRSQIASLATEQGWDPAVLGQEFTQVYGTSTMHADPAALAEYLRSLQERAAAALLDPAPGEGAQADPVPVEHAEAHADEQRDAAEWKRLIDGATTKPEVIAILRDLGMSGQADEQVDGKSLQALATAKMREVS